MTAKLRLVAMRLLQVLPGPAHARTRASRRPAPTGRRRPARRVMWPSTSRTSVRKTSAWWARRSVSSSDSSSAWPERSHAWWRASSSRVYSAGSKRPCSRRSSASFVDDAGVQHQVAHRPARQAEQAQQPVLHLGALDQQREVALAAQQRLDPVDEADRRVHRAACRSRTACRGAIDQRGQAHLAVVAQQLDLRLRAQRAHALARAPPGRRSRKASLSTGSGARAAGAAMPLPWRRGRAAVVQQRVELGGDALARRRAEQVEQLAGVRPSHSRGRGCARSSRGRRRRSAAGASAGRRGTGCGARRGAGTS